jgi:hypothetical protein
VPIPFAPALVLFDHGTPKGLARALAGHTVHTAQSKGWDTLSNGELLDAAEEARFELLLTTDRRIRHQQNLRACRIALVVLTGSTRWLLVRQHADRIGAAVRSATPGSYAEVEIPFEPQPGRERHRWSPGPSRVWTTARVKRVGACALLRLSPIRFRTAHRNQRRFDSCLPPPLWRPQVTESTRLSGCQLRRLETLRLGMRAT